MGMGVQRHGPVALTGSRAGTGAGRRLGHVAIGVVGWLALAALWAWQLEVYVPADWLGGVALIGVLLVGWTCFLLVWVAWSRGIYRRRHRRTEPLSRSVDFAHDALGRRIAVPPGIRTVRGQLLVSVSADGVKRYEQAPRRPLDPAPRVHRVGVAGGRPAARRRGRETA
jgi:hypothetical protein